jgi:dihydroorotase-like cyclic amidohydrolase
VSDHDPHSISKREKQMSDFDLVIRGGTVVTAADTVKADVGIRSGRIATVAQKIEGGTKVIDVSGMLVMPGGIDSHVHLAQPAFGGPAMADDFESGTRSAIGGGNTTLLPLPCSRAVRRSERASLSIIRKPRANAILTTAFI